MTPMQTKKIKEVYDDYRFRALLSVLDEEQLEKFNAYMKVHLPELESKLKTFLSPTDTNHIIKEMKKADKFG